jgi:hypothetical protein
MASANTIRVPVEIDLPGRELIKQLINSGNVVVVQPGDSLVIAFNRRLNDQEAEEATDYIGSVLPGIKFLLVPEVHDIAVLRNVKT